MPHNKVTFNWMEENIDLWRPMPSMLYVGWRRGSKMWWWEKFGKDLDTERIALLEVFAPNFNAWSNTDIEKFHGNVADVHKMFEKNEWHTVFWDHGPEHAPSEDWLGEVTEMLKENCSQIVYVCPWGKCPQSGAGNKYEEHAVSVTVEMLEGMGMTVQTFGKPDTGAAGELAAWWKRD